MENEFEVTKDGSTLNVLLDDQLSVGNAPALTEELSKYRNQGIEKVVFDVTGLIYLSSAGLRCIFYAFQELGQEPEIVFENCAKEIYEVLDHVGMTSVIKFEESVRKKELYRKRKLCDMELGEIGQFTKERKKGLDDFAANNDVVCYSMKMGQED